MAIWSRLTSIIAGIGISRSAGVVIEPALEAKRQDVWKEFHAAILAPREIAQLVVSGLMSETDGKEFALRNGLTEDRFKALLQLELHAGSLAQVLEIWNRHGQDKAIEPLVDHALAKERIETQYWPHIKDLATVRIPADLLAFAHQRGIVNNPTDPVTGESLMPVAPPTTTALDVNGQPSPIRQHPVALDVLAEFAATGWNFERAAVNARSRGLPPAPGELLQLVNRGKISVDEYYVGIGEGDTRNEWRDYLLALRRRLLTPHDYEELRLRGFQSKEEAALGAALSGMEPQDAELLYNMLGRSIAVHGITTGLARGGVFGGPTDQIPAAYLQSLQRGNLRPEYYSIGYANRFTYSVPFWWRALATAKAFGTIDPHDLLLRLGNPPEFAQAVVDFYIGTTKTVADPHVKSAVTRLLTVVHKEYVAGVASVAQVEAALQPAGVPQTSIDGLLTTWDIERAFVAALAPPPPGPTT